MGDGSGSSRSPGKDQPSPSSSLNDPSPSHHIFVIEDNRADVFLVRQALDFVRLRADIRVIEDGESAMRYVDEVDGSEEVQCPTLILLDLNLPKRNGYEVLQHIRASKRCGKVPVIVVTSSGSDDDRNQTAVMGADQYFRKPSGYEAFLKLGELIQETLAKREG